jgi:hypothetical protein
MKILLFDRKLQSELHCRSFLAANDYSKAHCCISPDVF